MFDFTFLRGQLPLLLAASATTISLTVVSAILASLLALPLAILRQSKSPAARIAAVYSWLLLTTPQLLVLFFAYYALPSVGLLFPPFETAVVGLALVASAYQLEIFRAGIISVPRGQFEAARALGIPTLRTWLRIILPQALPVIIPPYVSNLTTHLKGTSLAAIITVRELTGVGMGIITFSYRPLEILFALSAIYLGLNSVLTGLQIVAERTVGRNR